jgi:hypothetical protein
VTATTIFNIGTYWKMNKSFFIETIKMIESKLCMSSHWMVLGKLAFIIGIRNPRWTSLYDLNFNIGPQGKMNKVFLRNNKDD